MKENIGQDWEDLLPHIEETLLMENLDFGIEHVTDDCQCEGKFCPQCERWVCRLDYTRDKKRKDGLDAWCRSCNNAHRKAYREVHPQKAREMQERAYRKNLEHYRAYQQSYRETHGEEINRTRREKKYHATPESREKLRLYRERNHDWFVEYRRIANITRRARKRNAEGTYTVTEWEALKARYEYTCLCCGRREPEIRLTVDHVIPIVQKGSNSIENIQPLCLSCNSSKQAKTIDYRIAWEEKHHGNHY